MVDTKVSAMGAGTLTNSTVVYTITTSSTKAEMGAVRTLLAPTGIVPLPLENLREITANDVSDYSSHGGILTSDSTPTYARVNGATDKALRVTWAANNVDEVQWPPMHMPPDLDENTDVTIHLLGKMSGATNGPTIDVQVFDGIGDTEMGSSTASLSNTLAELSIIVANANISGHPTGFFNIALIPDAHGTDSVELYAAWVEYTRK